MLEILNPRHGAVLSHHDGEENELGLAIKVTGCADPFVKVMVNGVQAERDGGRFSATVLLTEKVNEITTEVTTVRGVTVVSLGASHWHTLALERPWHQ